MPPQVVFILSTDYAGSHFLTLQLGSHSRCLSIGEFHRFKYEQPKGGAKICSRCAGDEECPLFQGLTGVPVPRLFERLFANVHRDFPGVETLIDNSKHPRWCRRFLRTDAFESRFIHLLRDPRALVRHWMLNYDTNRERRILRCRMARRCWRHAWDILAGSDTNLFLWLWWYHNRMLTNYVRRHGLDARVVTYSDLVLEPDRALGDLVTWLGLEYEPGQKTYWQFVHHGTVKPQYMRAPEGEQLGFDRRWKAFLDAKAKQEALNHGPIHRYLEQIGLQLDVDRGLIAPRGV